VLVQLSSGKDSKQLAVLQEALCAEYGSVTCRALSARTIYVKEIALEARIDAMTPCGAVPRLTAQERAFNLTWTDADVETQWLATVSPRPVGCIPAFSTRTVLLGKWCPPRADLLRS
jgi:hypothetical protein